MNASLISGFRNCKENTRISQSQEWGLDMYSKIKEFYQKTGEWGPSWLTLFKAVSTDGISLILFPGLQIALHQIDGWWLRRALDVDMELGIYEPVHIFWMLNWHLLQPYNYKLPQNHHRLLLLFSAFVIKESSFPGGSDGKVSARNAGDLGSIPGSGNISFLEKEIAIHSSTLAWKIPWTEEPDRLQSMGSQRVRHDWATSLSLYSFYSKVRK